jgi:hypothetical protein
VIKGVGAALAPRRRDRNRGSCRWDSAFSGKVATGFP